MDTKGNRSIKAHLGAMSNTVAWCMEASPWLSLRSFAPIHPTGREYSNRCASNFSESPFAPTLIRIEHIGSTAVAWTQRQTRDRPALGASILETYEHIEAYSNGFNYVNKYEHILPMRRYFCSLRIPKDFVFTHGLITDGELWKQHIYFRDQLRQE